MKPRKKPSADALEPVEPLIREVRGERVLLDSDLARIYGVTTSRFNEAVKRNQERFPADFRFQLTPVEFANLISQIATSSSGHGGHRKLPWVFTEHGALMAANVLRSPQAVQMSVFVVRAFVALRRNLSHYAELRRQIAELERAQQLQGEDVQTIFAALRQLEETTSWAYPEGRRLIGFQVEKADETKAKRNST